MSRLPVGWGLLLAGISISTATPAVAKTRGVQLVSDLTRTVRRLQRTYRTRPTDFQRQLRRRLPHYVDLVGFCRRTLADYLGRLKAEQQREYLTVCPAFFRARYRRALTPRTPFALQGLRERTLRGGAVEVSGTVRSRRETWRVGFILTSTAQGWRIIDLKLDGVSLLRNYRARFRKTLRSQSYAALIAKLRAATTKFGRR